MRGRRFQRGLLAAAAVAAAALVLVGRWESDRADGIETRGLDGIRRAVGTRLLDPNFTANDVGVGLECLHYGPPGNKARYELCFDPEGRLVEGVDRSRPELTLYGFRYRHGAATFTLDPEQLRRLLAGASPNLFQ